MAGPVEGGPGSQRRRVFVLVDSGIAKGVFLSWDGAEAYADEHRLSLDHLMEYQTGPDYPDHLHLLTAKWDGGWQFQGEWKRLNANWISAPKKIRLDHYHCKGEAFHLLRQHEFDWQPGLMDRIDPMAPDDGLRAAVANGLRSTEAPPPAWKPKLAPLRNPEAEKSAQPGEGEAERKTAPARDGEDTPHSSGERTSRKPLISEPEPPLEDSTPPPPPDLLKRSQGGEEKKGKAQEPPATSLEKDSPLPGEEDPSLKKPIQLRKEPYKPKEEASKTAEEGPEEDASGLLPLEEKAKISFKKKPSLRLKKQAGPQPIPTFRPKTPPPPIDFTGKPSVELAYTDKENPEEEEEDETKVRRVWPARLILTVVVLVLCWAAGLFWVFRPKPEAATIVAEITSLTRARVLIMEPEMVFFQLPVDPVHQERWIQSLGLEPVPAARQLTIPTYHALSTWEQPEGFVRPPYSTVEVEEWWELRLRPIRYGFAHEWEDGSILILDLESDLLIGWAEATRLPDILN